MSRARLTAAHAALAGAGLLLLFGCTQAPTNVTPTTAASRASQPPMSRAVAAATPAVLDPEAIAARLAATAQAYEVPPIDARVAINPNGTIELTGAQAGRRLDVAASTASVLNGDGSMVMVEVAPSVTDADAELMGAEVDRVLHSRMGLTFDDQELTLLPEDIAPLLWIGGTTIGVSDRGAEALARLLAAELHKDPVDARFDWNGGKLKLLRPSASGRDLDIQVTTARLISGLLGRARSIELPVHNVAPVVSDDDADRLGSVQLIDRGSTSFAGSIPEKKANIKLAAERLNGVVVPPGATFSFNKELGPTSLESGFEWGFAINGGADGPRTVPSVGGGICQVATTLFQPVFWTGFPLEERYAHAYWIPAYASRGVGGLDVTVDADANLDFRWTNPTDSYILVQASTEGDTVRFALYGKKPNWRVDVAPASVSNPQVADPTPVTQEEPSMPLGKTLQVETARDGFDIAVTRVVTPLDGGDARSLTLRTHYQPSRSVTLVGTG